jgi:hypothetical protein
MKTTINDFDFEFSGYGHYLVTYISPKTNKKWSVITTNMGLIDATKNEGHSAKKSDLIELKKICKLK